MNVSANDKARRMKMIRSILWLLVPITIIAGQWYPLLGFVVPIVMVSAIITSVHKRGRYFCGTFCPRGAFYDKIVVHISPKRKIPLWFRNSAFRWAVVLLLMGLMIHQISLDAGNVYHWGRVFVRICLITTVLGVILALFAHPRTWCSFCPMGTIQGTIGRCRLK